MLTEDQICPYSRECQKYKNMDCRKLENFWECEDYIDFELESSGTLDDIIKDIIEELSKVDKTKKKSNFHLVGGNVFSLKNFKYGSEHVN